MLLTSNLDYTLVLKFKDAVTWGPQHRSAANAIAAQNKSHLDEWIQIRELYHLDPKNNKDAYREPDAGLSSLNIKLR